MAKKGKRTQGRVSLDRITLNGSEAPEAAESETNVILFPAKAASVARTGHAAQVAVNDATPVAQESAAEDELNTVAGMKAPETDISALSPTHAKVEAKNDKAVEAKKSDAKKPLGNEKQPKKDKAAAFDGKTVALGEMTAAAASGSNASVAASQAAGIADAKGGSKKNKKKHVETTSSAMIRAVSHADDQPHVAEQFFNSTPPELTTEHETWEDLKTAAEPMPPSSKRAMFATAGIVAVALAVIGSIVLYYNVWMPQPEMLGGTGAGGPVMRTMPAPAEERSAPAPAPSAAAPSNAAAQPTAPAPVASPEPLAEEVPAPEPTAEAAGTPTEAAEPAAEVALAEGPSATEETEPNTAANPAAEAPPAAAAPTPAGAEPVAAAVPGSYDELLTQARDLDRRGRRRQAEEQYRAAIAANPAGSQALSGLSMLLINKGANQEAGDLAQRAVTADPTNSEGWIVLGAARDGLRDRSGAREAYRNCVELGQGRFVNECRRMR